MRNILQFYPCLRNMNHEPEINHEYIADEVNTYFRTIHKVIPVYQDNKCIGVYAIVGVKDEY